VGHQSWQPLLYSHNVQTESDKHKKMILLQDLIDWTRRGEASRLYLIEGEMLKTNSRRTVIPNDAELRMKLFDEVHETRYTVHPDNNKMYQDLKKKFWWCGMKRNLAKYVVQYPLCQLVKAEHQRPIVQLQPL
jgi:hypothetical protein